jgi:hypothetical protein
MLARPPEERNLGFRGLGLVVISSPALHCYGRAVTGHLVANQRLVSRPPQDGRPAPTKLVRSSAWLRRISSRRGSREFEFRAFAEGEHSSGQDIADVGSSSFYFCTERFARRTEVPALPNV